MVRKLKTFQTSLGFFDLAIAAPSMKAALEAWGADSNLFHQGVAKQSDDPDVVAATMAKPGVVLRRPVGSGGRFGEYAELPTNLGSGEPTKAAYRPIVTKVKKPLSGRADKAAEQKAALAYQREERRRELERAKEKAARQKERDRRQQAVDRAQGALDEACRARTKSAAAIKADWNSSRGSCGRKMTAGPGKRLDWKPRCGGRAARSLHPVAPPALGGPAIRRDIPGSCPLTNPAPPGLRSGDAPEVGSSRAIADGLGNLQNRDRPAA
jgi:hypothetical protein